MDVSVNVVHYTSKEPMLVLIIHVPQTFQNPGC